MPHCLIKFVWRHGNETLTGADVPVDEVTVMDTDWRFEDVPPLLLNVWVYRNEPPSDAEPWLVNQVTAPDCTFCTTGAELTVYPAFAVNV